MNEYMTGQELKKYIIPSIIRDNGIKSTDKYPVNTVEALQLMTPSRADFLAKWLYIDYYIRAIRSDFGLKLYIQSLDIALAGKFFDQDTTYKNSPATFLDGFNRVIDAMSDGTFNFENTIIPVNSLGTVMDGAHRSAASIYFKRPIKTILIDNSRGYTTTTTFRRRGMPHQALDALANVANQAIPSIKTLLIIPTNKPTDEQATDILAKYGNLYYSKKVKFSTNGIINFSTQIRKLDNRFGSYPSNSSKVVYLYLFTPKNKTSLEKIENSLKNLGHSDHNVYIAETQQSSQLVGNLLLNQNSVHLLNHAKPIHLAALMAAAKKTAHNTTNNHILSPDATLMAYGVVSMDSKIDILENKEHKLDELIYNPNNNIYLGNLRLMATHIARNQVLQLPLREGGFYIKEMDRIIAMKRLSEYRTNLVARAWRVRGKIHLRSYEAIKRFGLLPLVHTLRNKKK